MASKVMAKLAGNPRIRDGRQELIAFGTHRLPDLGATLMKSSFTSWLCSPPHTINNQRSSPRRTPLKLLFEQLEDRIVPSVLYDFDIVAQTGLNNRNRSPLK